MRFGNRIEVKMLENAADFGRASRTHLECSDHQVHIGNGVFFGNGGEQGVLAAARPAAFVQDQRNVFRVRRAAIGKFGDVGLESFPRIDAFRPGKIRVFRVCGKNHS